ncbi:DUF3012 domain-containing protein [Pleionea litopenaei]|uniref:DUF3012 domain-containing protein n=1 Tax=Pleionea litopenaei TaxID=3070815 RepID=A0AA51RV94_9GAMM|nr:DUF3012 domain-containing protein [Pleionea sp. HL-JVS1]WMS88108.1 DUF3012 domain-containing protein [Pleionea sp. HL-JVS1]
MKIFTFAALSLLMLAACSPKVGSDEWCKQMKDKPKGDWTANEIGDYTKYCVLNQKPEN